MSHDPYRLPPDLPVPVDDGAADHLTGMPVPELSLPATSGGRIRVDAVPEGLRRLVLYAYPRTGSPGEPPLTPGWDRIPGARGCTPQSCAFRDLAAELRAEGAAVAGLSTQDPAEQAAAAGRLRLPFPLLSDADLRLARALRLPTFEVAGHTLLRRLTLVIGGGAVEHVFYPVFPPGANAADVVTWLRAHPASGSPS